MPVPRPCQTARDQRRMMWGNSLQALSSAPSPYSFAVSLHPLIMTWGSWWSSHFDSPKLPFWSPHRAFAYDDLSPLLPSDTFPTLLQDFPGSSAGKESTYSAGDPGLIPGLGNSPGEGIGYPLQYSWLPWWLSW